VRDSLLFISLRTHSVGGGENGEGTGRFNRKGEEGGGVGVAGRFFLPPLSIGGKKKRGKGGENAAFLEFLFGQHQRGGKGEGKKRIFLSSRSGFVRREKGEVLLGLKRERRGGGREGWGSRLLVSERGGERGEGEKKGGKGKGKKGGR